MSDEGLGVVEAEGWNVLGVEDLGLIDQIVPGVLVGLCHLLFEEGGQLIVVIVPGAVEIVVKGVSCKEVGVSDDAAVTAYGQVEVPLANLGVDGLRVHHPEVDVDPDSLKVRLDQLADPLCLGVCALDEKLDRPAVIAHIIEELLGPGGVVGIIAVLLDVGVIPVVVGRDESGASGKAVAASGYLHQLFLSMA